MSRLSRSSFALMTSSVASAALGMVFWATSAWAFPPAEVGRASAGSSAMMLLATLGQLALTSVFARVLPVMGDRRGRFVATGYTLVTIASMLLTIGFFAVGLGHQLLDVSFLSVAAFGLAVVATAISVVQDGALVSIDRASWVPAKNAAMALARVGLLPVFAGMSLPEPILIAWVAPTVAAVIIFNVIIFGRFMRAEPAPTAETVPSSRKIVRLIGGQYANSVVNALVMFFPPVLVTAMLGADANAVFFLPWMIATSLLGLLWNVVVPFVAQASTDKTGIAGNVRTMIRLGTLITVGGAAVLALGARLLLKIAGSSYADDGAHVLWLLAAALPFAAIITYFDAIELVRMRSWVSLGAKTLSAALFIGGAVIAIHAVDVVGAAVAYLASQILVGLLLLGPVITWYRSHTRPTAPVTSSEVITPLAVATEPVS